jgi:hypothetical protein
VIERERERGGEGEREEERESALAVVQNMTKNWVSWEAQCEKTIAQLKCMFFK